MSSFPDVSMEDVETIAAVVQRTLILLENQGLIDADRVPGLRMELNMDLTMAHGHNPLRLEEMLTARPGDLTHDVLGIHQNLNRRTGGFRECFQPRFAVRS